MMNETTLLESRLSKIEQDNRRLKLTVGALLLALTAVPLVGTVMPEQIPEVIQARKFKVIDENGTRRAGLNATGIGFTDETNNVRAGMNADGIAYFDESGNVVWCAPGC